MGSFFTDLLSFDHEVAVLEKDPIIKDSVILLEQIRTIDKSRLREKVCHLDEDILQRIDQALCISLALAQHSQKKSPIC